jgi:hypothetical protein
MVVLIEGDGHLRPSKPRQGGNGLNDVHLLLDDADLMAGLVGLRAQEDHQALLGLRELGVLPLSAINLLANLSDRLLGLAL